MVFLAMWRKLLCTVEGKNEANTGKGKEHLDDSLVSGSQPQNGSQVLLFF